MNPGPLDTTMIIHTVSADGRYMPVGDPIIGQQILDMIGGQDRLQFRMMKIGATIGDCVFLEGVKKIIKYYDPYVNDDFDDVGALPEGAKRIRQNLYEYPVFREIIVALLVVSDGNELSTQQQKNDLDQRYRILRLCLSSFLYNCIAYLDGDYTKLINVRCAITSLGCAASHMNGGGLSWKRIVDNILSSFVDKASTIMKMTFYIDKDFLQPPPTTPKNPYSGLPPDQLWPIYQDFVTKKKPVGDILDAILAFRRYCPIRQPQT